jgi:TonB family protein
MKALLPALLIAWTALGSSPRYHLRSQVVQGADGASVVSVAVHSKDGERLFAAELPMIEGSKTIDSRYGDITVAIGPHGWGYAMLHDSISVFDTVLPEGYVRFEPQRGIVAPKVVKHVEPHYPGRAHDAHVSGIATVDAQIDATGRVKVVRIVRDPGFGLGGAAADAVRQWQFEPATKDGQPVAVLFTLQVSFRIH